MYLNKVMIYGNLTRDPELRALPSGQQVVQLNVATNRSYKDKQGQQQESSEFHSCVAFGRTAEVIGQYFKKGRPIYVEGRLQTRSWESDGVKKYRTEIVVDSFQFGPSTSDRATADEHHAGREGAVEPDTNDPSQYPAEGSDADNIPF